MKIIQGDILRSSCYFICHQGNHLGVMGAGLAKKIADKIPDIRKSYYEHCMDNSFQSAIHYGSVHWFSGKLYGTDHIIATVVGQLGVGGKTPNTSTDIDALENGLYIVRDMLMMHPFATLAIPMFIGCGLGGGDREVVYNILKKVFGDRDLNDRVFLYVY